MKYEITKAEDIITIEVSKGNKVLLTWNFPLEGFDLEMAKKKLREEANSVEVMEKEKERKEERKNELKKLIGKKFDL